MNVDGSLSIPEDKLHLLNKSLDENWLRTALELRGGVTAIFDQVHCLVSCATSFHFEYAKWSLQNFVRQYTYRDQDNYDGLPAFDKSPAMLLDHVEHCIEDAQN